MYRLPDGALGLEVEAAVEVVGADFAEVALEGDGKIERRMEGRCPLLCVEEGAQRQEA